MTEYREPICPTIPRRRTGACAGATSVTSVNRPTSSLDSARRRWRG
jgi:hypothetical protein